MRTDPGFASAAAAEVASSPPEPGSQTGFFYLYGYGKKRTEEFRFHSPPAEYMVTSLLKSSPSNKHGAAADIAGMFNLMAGPADYVIE